MSQFDIQTITESLSASLIARLGQVGLSPEEQQGAIQVITEFNKIAGGMLAEEPGITLPNSEQSIPMDEKLLRQALTLFAEGIYYALMKCAEIGLPHDLRNAFIQELAMQVYGQAKQIVAATYGQENTPDFQFSPEQQIEFINKAADGYFVAWVTEYENANGPIEVELKEGPPALLNAAQEAPGTVTSPTSSPVGAAAAGPHPNDKYGAVALLLTTLTAQQRTRLLKSFTPEEKELIGYYSYPQHLQQLDLRSVEAHLQKLREILKKDSAAAKSKAYQGISELAKMHTAEKLLSWVKDERPAIRQYLQAHCGGSSRSGGKAITGPMKGSSEIIKQQRKPTPLPNRIEDILYQYLKKRLSLEAGPR